MGPVSHYLGLKFQRRKTSTRTSVHISLEAFIENLIKFAGLDLQTTTKKPSPYLIGNPIDSVQEIKCTTDEKQQITSNIRHLVGSLLWLSQGTHPDIAVVTSLLAQHQNNPYPGHIYAAKHVIKYLKGPINLGISFHSDMQLTTESFIHFPIDKTKVTGHSDENWGPQDQIKPTSSNFQPLELFKTRSMSGFLISLHGPVHWTAKRQTITARSST